MELDDRRASGRAEDFQTFHVRFEKAQQLDEVRFALRFDRLRHILQHVVLGAMGHGRDELHPPQRRRRGDAGAETFIWQKLEFAPLRVWFRRSHEEARGELQVVGDRSSSGNSLVAIHFELCAQPFRSAYSDFVAMRRQRSARRKKSRRASAAVCAGKKPSRVPRQECVPIFFPASAQCRATATGRSVCRAAPAPPGRLFCRSCFGPRASSRARDLRDRGRAGGEIDECERIASEAWFAVGCNRAGGSSARVKLWSRI